MHEHDGAYTADKDNGEHNFKESWSFNLVEVIRKPSAMNETEDHISQIAS